MIDSNTRFVGKIQCMVSMLRSIYGSCPRHPIYNLDNDRGGYHMDYWRFSRGRDNGRIFLSCLAARIRSLPCFVS